MVALSQLVALPDGRAAVLKLGVPDVVKLLAHNYEKPTQQCALSILAELTIDEAGQLAVGEVMDAPSHLVRHGRSKDQEVRAVATRILCNEVKQDRLTRSLISAGAVVPLLANITDASISGTDQRDALIALAHLAAPPSGQVAIASANGVRPLLELLLREPVYNHSHSLRALRALAENADTRQAVAGESIAVRAMVPMLTSADPTAQEHAAAALAHLCDANCGPDILAEGGLPGFTALLQAESTARRYAVRALHSLVDDRASHAPLAASGLARLVELSTKSNDETIREGATATLVKLGCGGDQSAVEAMASSEGLIELLVRQLGGGADEQHSATMVLVELSAHASALASLVKLGGVAPLVSVAEQHESAEARRAAAMVLARLAAPPHGAVAVSTAGFIRVLLGNIKLRDPDCIKLLALALRHLALLDEGRDALLKDGEGAATCVSLLAVSHGDETRFHALEALSALATESRGQLAIDAAGGVAVVVELAKARSNDAPVRSRRKQATKVICGLAQESAIAPKLVTAGAVPPLVAQLSGGGEDEAETATALQQLTGAGVSSADHASSRIASAMMEVQRRRKADSALSALISSATQHASISVRAQISAVASGVLDPLIAILLRPQQPSGGAGSRLSALQVLHNLVQSIETRHAVASHVDAVAACVLCLDSSDLAIQQHAAATLSHLSDSGSRSRTADIIDMKGAVPSLCKLLRSNSNTVQLEAARTLAHLADNAASHALIATSGLQPLVVLAGLSSRSDGATLAASTLVKLAGGDDDSVLKSLATSEAAIAAIIARLDNPVERERQVALNALLHLSAHPEALAAILPGAAALASTVESDGDATIRKGAAIVLARLAAPPHSEALAAVPGVVSALSTALALPAHALGSSANSLKGELSVAREPRHPSWVFNDEMPSVAEPGSLVDSEQLFSQATLLAVTALEHLASVAKARSLILKDALSSCISLLSGFNSAVQLCALGVLQSLSQDSKGRDVICQAGVTAPLVSLVESGDDPVQQSALRVLRALATDRDKCKAFVDTDAVQAVLPLIFSAHPETQADAMGVLGAVSVQLADPDVLAGACNWSTIKALALYTRDPHDVEHFTRRLSKEAVAAIEEDATVTLALLATHQGNARHLVGSGGAYALAKAMLTDSGASAMAKERAKAGLAVLGKYVCCFTEGFDALLEDAGLFNEPAFWCEGVATLVGPRVRETYPKLSSAPNALYAELFRLIGIVQLRLRRPTMDGPSAAASLKEVLENFENEPASLDFIASVFPSISARSRSSIEEFAEYVIADLPDMAAYGCEVVHQLEGMPLAERAITALYERYLANESPLQWKTLFKEATRTAYNLKYMFRESLPKAKEQFRTHLDHNLRGGPRAVFSGLLDGAFDMYQGLVDQAVLAQTDFLTNPQALLKVVRDNVKGKDKRVELIGEIAAKYMQTYLDHVPPKLPLTPHHTQVIALLLFSQFFEQRAELASEHGMRGCILQMKTGEGKSIVIAMMAIYTVKMYGKKVHVLENNEGLLERDFANYEGFYRSFGLTCAKSIDATSDICYCLKRQNNAFFNEHILAGDLDLSSTVLIVDEVDDLVVNEKPTLLYKARDQSLTPFYKMAYAALIKGKSRPPKVDSQIWNDCKRIKAEADSKVRGVHYEKDVQGWAMLEVGADGIPRMPKVPLTDDWLVYRNYADFDLDPAKDTFRNCLCTPYMYTKYCCIFGLTGSVGGEVRTTAHMVTRAATQRAATQPTPPPHTQKLIK